MQDSTFIHSFAKTLLSWIGPVLGLAMLVWACLGAGCGSDKSGQAAEEPLEFTQDISRFVYEGQGNGWALKLTAANLGFRGLGATQRALLEMPELQVSDARGQTLVHLTAQNAIALHPYREISWRTYSLENVDATTFEGEELVWPYLESLAEVGLLGPTLVLLPTAIVEGDTLVGDLFLRGYEIKHVRSVLPLDSVANDPVNIEAHE